MRVAAVDAPVETETLAACPGCGGAELVPWREGRDLRHGLSSRSFPYARCRGCRLLFLSTRPVEAAIGGFYPPEYGPYHARQTGERQGPRPGAGGRRAKRLLRRLNDLWERLIPDRTARELERFYRPPRPGARLLDFGCGSPRFLDSARQRGWATAGMDFAPGVVERLRQAGHTGWGSFAEIPDASLDAVRLHHVLEHLYRPREVLESLRRKMAPGARLHVGLPHPGGPSSRLFRSCWWGLECPRHVMLYSPRVARRLLQELGFEVERLLGEALAKDLARSWGFFLESRGWQVRGGIAALPGHPLAEALRQPLRMAAALGLADRFHLLARCRGEGAG